MATYRRAPVTFRDAHNAMTRYLRALNELGWKAPDRATAFLSTRDDDSDEYYLVWRTPRQSGRDPEVVLWGAPGFDRHDFEGYIGSGVRDVKERLEYVTTGIEAAIRLRDDALMSTDAAQIVRLFEDAAERANQLLKGA